MPGALFNCSGGHAFDVSWLKLVNICWLRSRCPSVSSHL